MIPTRPLPYSPPRYLWRGSILEWSQDGKTPGLFETQQTIVRAVYERVVYRPEKDLLYEATVPVPLRKGKPVWAGVSKRGSSMKLARIRAS
jgi:hypothetical protein